MVRHSEAPMPSACPHHDSKLVEYLPQIMYGGLHVAQRLSSATQVSILGLGKRKLCCCCC